jgi:AcrR family transcriptional regulator
MRDLADAVGLEVSSLYNHIKSKEDLLIKICFECEALFSKGIDSILNTNTSPIKKLEMVVDLHIEIAIHHRVAVTVFNDEWKHLPESQLSTFLKSRRDYEAKVIQIIKEAKAKNEIIDIDEQNIMRTIISAISWIFYLNKPFNKSNEDLLKRDIKSLLFNGLGK